MPKREEGTLFSLQQVLIELFVTEQDRQPFERALDGGSAVLIRTDGFDDAFQRLGLNEEAAEIASKIDGKQTAAEIAASAGKDVFNTYKLLEALRALGLLRKEEKPQPKDELGFGSVGVADAADAWSSGKMPAFQLEPEPPVESLGEEAPKSPAAIAVPNPPEVQWGFDEAQIETVEKTATPPPPPPKPRLTQTQTRRTPSQFTRTQPKKERHAPIFAIIVLLILAAAAFGGWYWWKGQAPEQKKPVVVKPPVTQTTEVNTGAPAAVIPPPQPSVGAGPPAGTVPAREPAPTQSSAKFTIQIELVCQESSLKKAMDIGGANVWSVPINYRGQQCHRVFWGHYGDRAEAEAATTQVPAGLRGSKPVVVTIPQP